MKLKWFNLVFTNFNKHSKTAGRMFPKQFSRWSTNVLHFYKWDSKAEKCYEAKKAKSLKQTFQILECWINKSTSLHGILDTCMHYAETLLKDDKYKSRVIRNANQILFQLSYCMYDSAAINIFFTTYLSLTSFKGDDTAPSWQIQCHATQYVHQHHQEL